ncbi:MAG: hypothetical protein KDE27_25695 [Planctomycetes bacterium]|nr:hypothetical protein [Planctomycetota bacterium]
MSTPVSASAVIAAASRLALGLLVPLALCAVPLSAQGGSGGSGGGGGEGGEGSAPNECCPPPDVSCMLFGGMNLGEQAVDFRDAGVGVTTITTYGTTMREVDMPMAATGLQGLGGMYGNELVLDVSRSAWDGDGPLIEVEIPVPDLHYENLIAEGPVEPGSEGAGQNSPSSFLPTSQGMVQPRPGTMPGLYVWHSAYDDTFYQYGSPVESGANPQSTAIYPPQTGGFRSNQLSGAILVQFNPGSGSGYGQNGHYLEIQHVDGTVARFDYFNPFVSGYSAGWLWRLTEVRDPFDNIATFSYDGLHRLTSITFPSGLVQSFDYAPAWPGWTWDNTTSGLQVSYAQAGTQLPGRTWGLVFSGTLGTSGGTHFALRPYRLYAAVRRVQKDQVAPGTPLAAGATTAQVVHQLDYTVGGSLATVSETNHVHHGTPFDQLLVEDPSMPGKPILDTHFDIASRRVTSQVKPQTQVRLDVSYPPAQRTTDLLPGESLTAIAVSDAAIGSALPNVTRYEFHYGTGKLYSIVSSAGDDAEGRPRAYSGIATPDIEPETIDIYRIFDGTCTCQKPVEVRTRSLVAGVWSERVTQYEYYPITKLLKKRTEPNPATQPLPVPPTVDYEFTYVQAKTGSQVWGAWLADTETTPDGKWTYHYGDWLDRKDAANHGRIAGSVERRSASVVTQPTLSGPTGVGSPISEFVYRNLSNAPGGLAMSGGVAGVARRVVDGDGVAMTIEYTAEGWRKNEFENNGQTLRSYSHDAGGNVTQVVENAGSAHALTWTYPQQSAFGLGYEETATGTAVPRTRLFYYDRYGHLAIVQRNNLASDGNGPTQYGGGSTGRRWIEAQWIYHHHQLWEAYDDRLPLDEPAGTGQFLQTTYLYHQNGQLDAIVHANGGRTVYEFDGYDTLYTTTERDPTGTRTATSPLRFVNPFLELVGTRHVAGPGNTLVAAIVRNGAGVITEVTEPTAAAPAGYAGSTGGAVHRFEIDAVGRIVEARSYAPGNLTDPLRERELRYDQLGRRIWQRDAVLGEGTGDRFVAWRYEDGKERLQTSERSGVGERSYLYEASGLLGTVLDTHGNQLSLKYHAGTTYPSQRKKFELEPDGTTRTTFAEFDVDPLGQVLAMKDGVAQLTYRYSYGSLGRVDRFVDPMLREQRVLWDAQGRVVEHVKIGDAGDLIRLTAAFVDAGEPDGRTRELRYDDLGNQHVVDYDFAGRPFVVMNPGSSVEPTAAAPNQSMALYAEYDEASRLAAIYDGDGGKTQFWHDGPGRLIQRELAATGSSIALWNSKDVFNRDAIGRPGLIGMNGGGPGGNHGIAVGAEVIKQDSLGRVHEEDFWSGWSPANVLQVTSTFAGGDPNRRTLDYADNLPVASAPLSLSYGYDEIGRLESIDWTGHTGTAKTSLATYSWVGGLQRERKVRLTANPWPEARTSFDYDEHGRLRSIRGDIYTSATPPTSPTSLFDYEYDDASSLVKERYAKVDGSAGDRFAHDAFHRLTGAWLGASQAVMNGAEPSGWVSGVAEYREYGLDGANNRTQVDVWTSGAGPASTLYSRQTGSHPQGPSNRYDTVGPAGTPELFTYDNRGNLTYDGRFFYKYDYLSRLQEVWKVVPEGGAVDGAVYAPVKQGALAEAEDTARHNVDGLLQRLAREHTDPAFRDRLVARIRDGVQCIPAAEPGSHSEPAILVEDATLELCAVYTYDAFNRRVGSVVVGVETQTHAWDRWRQVSQNLDVGGYAVPVKQFVWGCGLDELVGYRRNNAGTWENYYLLHGGQDTAAKLVDDQGQVVEHYEYDPYGTASVYVGSSTTPVASSSVGLPFLYKAMELRTETGLHYARNRWYSSAHGRFLSGDLLGVYGDALNAGNRYAYAGNRPLVIGDPLGLQGGGGIHVVMTNFGEFSGDTHNSSQDFTKDLGAGLDAGKVSNDTVTLPVEWDEAQKELKKAIDKAKKDHPDKKIIVIATGQGLDCFEVENNGKNKRKPYKDETKPKAKTPGKDGTPTENDPGGKDSYPAPSGAGDVGKAGGMGSSNDAGGFICDSVAYELYKQVDAGNADGGAFVHVPNEPDPKDKKKTDEHNKKVKDTADGVAKYLCDENEKNKKKDPKKGSK